MVEMSTGVNFNRTGSPLTGINQPVRDYEQEIKEKIDFYNLPEHRQEGIEELLDRLDYYGIGYIEDAAEIILNRPEEELIQGELVNPFLRRIEYSLPLPGTPDSRTIQSIEGVLLQEISEASHDMFVQGLREENPGWSDTEIHLQMMNDNQPAREYQRILDDIQELRSELTRDYGLTRDIDRPDNRLSEILNLIDLIGASL